MGYGVRETAVEFFAVGVPWDCAVLRRVGETGFAGGSMSLMAAPRTVYSHNPAAESAIRMEKQAPTSVLHYFSPFILGSFPLRALRRLAMAFNSLSAMAPASFHLNAIRLATLKKDEGDESQSDESVEEGESSASQPRLPLLWFPRFGRSVKEINEVQKRREIAMERVIESEETERRVVPFVNARGQTILTQSWTPANAGVDLKYVVFLFFNQTLYNLSQVGVFLLQLENPNSGI